MGVAVVPTDTELLVALAEMAVRSCVSCDGTGLVPSGLYVWRTPRRPCSRCASLRGLLDLVRGGCDDEDP